MSEEIEKKVRKRRRWPWLVVGSLMALVVALVMLAPTIIVSLKYPKLTIDLLPVMGDSITNLVASTTATVDFDISRDGNGGYVVKAKGHFLDWPYTARVDVLPKFRFLGVDATGGATVSLDDTPWQLTADFKASSSGEWQTKMWLDKTEFGGNDPIIGQILSRLNLLAVSNLAFNGTVDLSIRAECTKDVPVPKWAANCNVTNVNVTCEAGGNPISIENLRMRIGATGIADHRDISPIFPRADSIMVAGFTLSNAFAKVHTSERTTLVTNNISRTHGQADTSSGIAQVSNVVKRAFLVTEAGARCCDGDLRIYSFFLNDDRINVTLFVDGIDTGATLKHINGFNGDASGRLYGKMPLRYDKNAHALRLNSTYLYSVPGEIGNLRIRDSTPIIDNLAMGGVPSETCDNLSKALTDLAYDALKISLQPEEDGGMALKLKIAGKSRHKEVTVPVSLEVTFHGALEQLLNLGLRTLTK